MKNLLLVCLIFISSQSLGQIIGKSKIGGLISHKIVPELILIKPIFNENQEINTDSDIIEIQGKIKDEYGIDKLTINDDNISWSSSGDFFEKFPLKDGLNSFIIKVTNIGGKSTEKEFKVNFIKPDEIPTITIVEPLITESKRIIYNKESITIKGLLQNIADLKELRINGRDVDFSQNGEFITKIELMEGENPVEIIASTHSDKKSNLNFSILYSAPITSPVILLSQPHIPANNIVNYSESKLIVKGNVKDNYGIESINLNGIQLSSTVNGDFNHEFELSSGENNISIKVINKKGKTARKDFIVNAILKVSTPSITLIEPVLNEKNEIFHQESIITVRGKVIDDINIASILVNNQPTTLIGQNEFYTNIKLNQGTNNILIKATNIQGYSSEKVFIVNTPIDLDGPEIVILEPTVQRGLKIVRKTDVINVRGKVTDQSGVMEMYVNKRKVNISPENEFSTKMYLSLGENNIIVKAVDNKLNITQDTFIVNRQFEELLKTGKYYAFVIGINSYDGIYWPPLRNAVNDASEFAKVINTNYRFDEIFTLYNESATRRNIIERMEWFTKNVTRNDNVVIYYAGHGQFKRELNKGYWVPIDAKSNSIVDFISNNEIKTLLSGIPSKHTLLISDACFAGDIFRGAKTENRQFDPNNMSKYYKEVYRKPSRLALTSGALEQVSDAGRENHSVFSYFLLKALKENSNKYIDVNQLYNEFRVAVINNSDQTPLLQVIKDTNDEGGLFVFIKK